MRLTSSCLLSWRQHEIFPHRIGVGPPVGLRPPYVPTPMRQVPPTRAERHLSFARLCSDNRSQLSCAIVRRRDRHADSTLKVYRNDLEKRLARLLALKPHAAGQKFATSDPEVPATSVRLHGEPRDRAHQQWLRTRLEALCDLPQITNGSRVAWAAAHYADVRSVIETARRRGTRAFHAIRITLAEQLLPLPA
jgi:hypothetical protein